MNKRVYLPAILLVIPFATTIAQEQALLEPGARVRITASILGIEKEAATFESLRGDTLVVTADSTMYCPHAAITKLERYQGRKSHWLTGMGIGAAVGAGAGLAIGAAVDCYDFIDMDEATCRGFGAAFGAGAGLLLGTGIGFAVRTDRWEEVPLDQLRPTVVAQRGGVALRISVAF
jgi:hypothetical protein